MSVKLSYLLVGALAAVGVMTSAYADVVEVDGAHVKFVYDTDFWGTGTATILGDSISFAIDPAFSLTRTVGSFSLPVVAAHADASAQALTVVAKAGYAVNFGVSSTYGGTYSVAPTGFGSAGVAAGGLLSGGSYVDGVYSRDSGLGVYGGGIQFSNGTSGVIDQTDVLNRSGSYQALQASVALSSGLAQAGAGTTSVALTSFAYQFNTTQVAAPVPEPETYGMLLGGLALLGMVARRRKSAAS
jgi:hypothetical protein